MKGVTFFSSVREKTRSSFFFLDNNSDNEERWARSDQMMITLAEGKEKESNLLCYFCASVLVYQEDR